MSIIADAFRNGLQRFSWGEPVYLRKITSAGGNADLGIEGTLAMSDYLITPRPSLVTLLEEDVIGAQNVKVGDVRVFFMFNDTITESLFGLCAGLVVGGTYIPAEGVVTGGRFMPFLSSTAQLQYMGTGLAASGVLVVCTYEGEMTEEPD